MHFLFNLDAFSSACNSVLNGEIILFHGNFKRYVMRCFRTLGFFFCYRVPFFFTKFHEMGFFSFFLSFSTFQIKCKKTQYKLDHLSIKRKVDNPNPGLPIKFHFLCFYIYIPYVLHEHFKKIGCSMAALDGKLDCNKG